MTNFATLFRRIAMPFRDYMASGKPVVGGVPAKVIKKIEA
jgi:hypothetical protein